MIIPDKNVNDIEKKLKLEKIMLSYAQIIYLTLKIALIYLMNQLIVLNF